jgi:hypothetical protein
MKQALLARRTKPIALPAIFQLKVTFDKAADAYEKSFYPARGWSVTPRSRSNPGATSIC